ncbi:MAG: hypothetical protein CMJ39_07480 [Phycisphaerae bacterium]|nr:hypothetical protein [Phycisphaerae bacterium]|tara:strand:+ start:56 stop:583 length:528 start_codon:yes stop_codon:yes gene_type:complete
MVNRRLISILSCLLLATGCAAPESGQSTSSTPERLAESAQPIFHVHEHTLRPAVAIDPTTRQRGLQNQTPPDDGLILCFPFSKRQSLWMPNCPYPLEAWVISDHGEVLEILPLPSEPPQQAFESDWSYQSRLPRHLSNHETRFMWEFASGEARRRSITPGDFIEGPWLDLKEQIR